MKHNAIPIGLAALIVIIYFSAVAVYAVNAPIMDDYIQFLGFHYFWESAADTWDRISLLFSQPQWDGGPQSEHRIFIARLASLGLLEAAGGINFKLLILLGDAFLLGIMALLWRLTPDLEGWHRLPVVLLLFSFIHYEISFWSSASLLYYPATFFALLTFSWAERMKGARGFLGTALSGACSTLSQTNGLMAFPAAALTAALNRRYRHAVILAALAALAFTLYLWDFQRPAAVPRLDVTWQTPLLVGRAWLYLIGGVFDDYAILGGSLLIAIWLFLLWKGYWKDRFPLFALGVWLYVSLLMVAFGRAALGPSALGASRYEFYSAMLVAVTYLALMERGLSRSLKRLGFLSTTLLVATIYLLAIPPAFWYVTTVRTDAIHDMIFYRTFGYTPYAPQGFPRADLADFLISFNEKHGVFRPPDLGRPSSPYLLPPLPKGEDRRLFIAVHNLRIRGHGLAIRGTAALEGIPCNAYRTYLTLVGEETRETFTTTPYRAVLNIPPLCQDFAAVIDFSHLPPGEYRLAVSVIHGGKLYQTASAHKVVQRP